MTPVNIALTVFVIVVVLLAILFLWLAHTFTKMDFLEKEIYENELIEELNDDLAKKALDEIDLRDKLTDITKQTLYKCPTDTKGRSCKHYNGATGYIDIDCKDCDWWNNGVRPSKGFGM